MSGRFNTSSMALPMYMLVMIPQKTSGACLTSKGPGWSPWIIKAPSRIAMTALAGMPRVSRGMNAPPAAALLAASGPATPSIAPAPNRSGCRDTRFSTAYEANDAMIAPLEIQEHLGDSEEPHDDRHQPEAVLERADPEGEPKPPADRVLTDGAT